MVAVVYIKGKIMVHELNAIDIWKKRFNLQYGRFYGYYLIWK